MARPRSVFDTLTDAVNDLAANGYDSEERVSYWRDAIRRAAEAAGKNAADVERMVRSSLGTVYHRLVDRAGLLKMHPGVARFTVDRVRPQLRAELDRRIRASADLIKLNRKAAVEKTLQRFSGWATSVPKGGTRTADKVETKAAIGKALRDLPFVERRCIIDQSSKLVSSINDVVAVGGGAIAGCWHSNFRQSGYNARHSHKERDGKYYLIRNSWAHDFGLVKPSIDGYTDQITQPAEEVFCRCQYRYVYAIRDLPEEMITAKGREELERVRTMLK